MAAYFAMRIEAGAINYNTVFGFEKYQKYKDDVDAILAVDGYSIAEDGTATKAE